MTEPMTDMRLEEIESQAEELGFPQLEQACREIHRLRATLAACDKSLKAREADCYAYLERERRYEATMEEAAAYLERDWIRRESTIEQTTRQKADDLIIANKLRAVLENS